MADYARVQRMLDDAMRQSKVTKTPGFKYRMGSTQPTFGELSGFEKAIDVLSRPLYATASFADTIVKGGNPFLEAIKGFAGHRRTTFSDVLGSVGMQPGLARTVFGFAADVLADPLTYVGVGPVKAAGTMTVKGVPRTLSAAGMAAKEAAIGEKTAQATRVLAHPRLTPSRLEGLQKRLPADLGALTRDASPEAMRGATGAAAFGSKYGRDAISRLMGQETRLGAAAKAEKVTPGLAGKLNIPAGTALEAPRAVKFAGMPLVRTETLGKAVKPVLGPLDKAVTKIPVVGKGYEATKGALQKTGDFLKAKFSSKTGNAEYDFMRTFARDLQHRMDVETGDFWKAMYKEAEDIVGSDPVKRRELNREWIKAIEGVEQDVKRLEPSGHKLAIDARIQEFSRRVSELSGKIKPFEAKVAGAKEALKGAEAAATPAAIRDKVLLDLPGKEKAIKDEAVRAAIKEKEDALRGMEANDEIAIFRGRTGPITIDKKTAAKFDPETLAELKRGGVIKITNKNLGIEDIEEAFIRGGAEDAAEEASFSELKSGIKKGYFDKAEVGEFIEKVTRAGAARAKARKELAALKGTKKEIKAAGAEVKPPPGSVPGEAIPIPKEVLPDAPPPSPVRPISEIDVPGEFRDAVETRVFKADTAAAEQAAFKKVGDLKAALAKEESSPRRAILKAQLDEAETAVKQYQAKADELKKRGGDVMEVNYKERKDYVPDDPRIKALADKFRERMERIYVAEKRVNPLLGHRERYVPHTLPQVIRDSMVRIVKQRGLHTMLKTGDLSTFTKHALERSNEKGLLDVWIDDLIRTGDIDVNRLKAELKKEGRELSSFDELLFETDPVKAGMGRELAHNRAITAGRFADEVLNSPSFTKAVVNVDEYLKLRASRGAARSEMLEHIDPEVSRITKLLDQYPDHSLFVPSPEYVRMFTTSAEKDAMRQGGHRADIDLLKKLLGVEDEIADKLAKGEIPKGLKAYIIPDEIADHLNTAHRLMNDDKRVAEFLKTFDKWQGWWKAFSTVVRPAFHVRNAVSNMWQNFVAGVNDPAAYSTSFAILRADDLSKVAGAGKYSAAEIKKLADEFGVLKHGYVGSEIGEFLEKSVKPSKNVLATEGPLVRAGQKVGTGIEDHARLANFIDGLKKGMDPASAAMRVKKYLFDYADLSEFEKTVMRRIAPFYTFTRKSIPLAVETVLTQPGKVAALGKVRTEAEKHFESIDREYLAEYINQSFGIPVHKNADGSFEYFLLKGYIPTVDIAKLDHKELLGMLSPFVKAPVEQILNTDFFRMKPISRFPTETVEFMGMNWNAKLAHALRNIVVAASIDREFMRSESKFGKGAVGFLTGIRLQNQNPVDQMRRYVLNSQVELGELNRLAKKAKEQGNEGQARQYESMAAIIEARRNEAKTKTLKLDPKAFQTRKGEAKPEKPVDIKGVMDRMRRETSLKGLLEKDRREMRKAQ